MKRLHREIHMPKKHLAIALACFLASGCTSAMQTKNFRVVTDPRDAVIKVVSGLGQHEKKYATPAEITMEIPREPRFAARASLMISKEHCKTVVLRVLDIPDDDTLKVKLECDQHIPDQPVKTSYQMRYRLLAPVPADKLKHQLAYHMLETSPSDEIRFQDQTISISFSVGARTFGMNLHNLASHPLKILWRLAAYTDVQRRPYRIMHSGIRYQDRNNPIPDKVVASGGSVQETITPIERVYVSPQMGAYEIMPLFTRLGDDGAGLKGKTFNLFIPIEINRTIIPYNFKIEITDVDKATAKD